MFRVIISFLLLFCLSINTSCQIRLLESNDVLDEIKRSLSHLYNYQFTEARSSLSLIRDKADGHPSIPFLEALIIYWENYPMTIDNPDTPEFLLRVEEAYNSAGQLLKTDPDDLEGIFFDLFGKAFYVMFWADNGKPGKVLPYLSVMYKQTIAGFTLKESFNEFYFTTGLYNYYITAYPEKHPSYKPIAMLFRKGDKEEGLRQLEYCAENAVFLRVEARFFLSFIYLSYENNVRKASEYASMLYREFPGNSFYTGLYAQILMLDNKFPLAEVLIKNLDKKDNNFSSMQAFVLRGIYLEKYKKDYEAAFSEYQKGLELSQKYGPLTKDYTALSLMGIGRYYKRNANLSAASGYYKMAKNTCSYDYIITDK